MMKRHLRWRIAFPYIALILIVLAGLTIYISNTVRAVRITEMEEGYAEEARALASLIGKSIVDQDHQSLDGQVNDWAALFQIRVTVVDTAGTVLAESDFDAAEMGNHLDRPEIARALEGATGSSSRFSPTLQQNMLYLAAPVLYEGNIVAVARVAVSLQEVESQVARLRGAIFLAMLAAMLAAAVVGVVIADRVTMTVARLDRAARRMAAGDLGTRYLGGGEDEIGRLGDSFNLMASRLQQKVSQLSTEQDRLTTILDHMADGVLIVSSEGRVRRLNAAAERFLTTTESDALGRSYARVLRHHELIELVQCGLSTGVEQQAVVSVALDGLYMRAIYTPLAGDDVESGLIILQDLTIVRSAEKVRRDFVSNASHELRTPLASLKALVETLRDGALEDPPAARRFLDLVEDQVDSLTQMVHELLELSRIESGKVPLVLETTSASDIIEPPVDRLAPQASRAGIALRAELPDGLASVTADALRLHQVITNLVHNAIKFTDPGGSITVRAEIIGDEMVISVSDTGVGIPEADQPRIFERFYKTDRSRTGGGTGLGLAICKHIVQQHGGQIWVDSDPGAGSVFSFSLPLQNR